MPSMEQLLKAAVQAKGPRPSGNTEQKDVAKSLQEAMVRARKRFLSEHPEAAKRPFGKASKEKQEKEKRRLEKKNAKDPMTGTKEYSSPASLSRFSVRDVELDNYQDNALFSHSEFSQKIIKQIIRQNPRMSEVDALRKAAQKPGVKLHPSQKRKILQAKKKKYF